MSERSREARMAVQWWAVDRPALNRLHSAASGRHEIAIESCTDLVVEGYPRSANTLLSQGLRVMNPGLHVACRSHGVGLISRALARSVAVVLTLRRPEEAIPSCAAYLGIGIGMAARRYAALHESVLPLALPVITFETIVDDEADLEDVLQDALGISVNWPVGAPARREMHELIERRFGPHPPTPKPLVDRAARAYEDLPTDLRARVDGAYAALRETALVPVRDRWT